MHRCGTVGQQQHHCQQLQTKHLLAKDTLCGMMMMVLFFKMVEAMQIVVVRQALCGVWRLLWVRGLI